MFTVRPYPQIPSIVIHWEGTNTQAGSPVAIEMVGGHVDINNEPFATPDGTKTTLLSEEKAALTLVCAGVSAVGVQHRICQWFDDPLGSIRSLYRKLGAGGMRAGQAAVSLAYEKEVLLPQTPPNLSAIREERRGYFKLVPMLGTSHSLNNICSALGIHLYDAGYWVDCMAADLGLSEVEKKQQLLVALAGASGILPRYSEPIDLPTLVRLDPDKEERLFPPVPTKSMWIAPFNKDPRVLVRFTGQSVEKSEPDIHTGSIDRIWIEDAIIDVHNPFIDEEKTERLLTPRELALFVSRCVGMGSKEATAKTAVRGSGDQDFRTGIYDKLLPADKRKLGRHLEQSIRAAVKRQIFVSRREPNLHLPTSLIEKLFRIMPLVGEGKSNATIGQELGTNRSTVSSNLELLRAKTRRRTAALVLLAEATNVTLPITDEEVRHDLASQQTAKERLRRDWHS